MPEYSLKKSNRTEKDLFTYKAYLEKVIDGDTFWVVLDIGLGSISRQKLRLQGIDCPELNTPAGKRAKRFVESLLRGVPFLIVRSSKNDKYDRYEADVFLPARNLRVPAGGTGSIGDQCLTDKTDKEIFINDLLLKAGHAVRMKN